MNMASSEEIRPHAREAGGVSLEFDGPDSTGPGQASIRSIDPERLTIANSDAWSRPSVDASESTRLVSTVPNELTIDWEASTDPGPSRAERDSTPGPRYRTEGFHKRGGIGQVWRVFDAHLLRTVALKELRDDRVENRRLVHRFLREAQVTSQLQHPNIVPVHDLARGPDGRVFYTMKFVEGRTLRDAIADYHAARVLGKADPLEFRELIAAVIAIARALGYAHSRGVIHRDLKPQNVVLGDFGEIFLLDWGLAGLRFDKDAASADPEELGSAATKPPVQPGDDSPESRTSADDVLGTLPYMPPEQAEGRHERVDRRSDVFGLGAILYHLLTNRAPLKGASCRASYGRIWSEGIAPPRNAVADTPRPLEAVCMRALAADPAGRYESAHDLAEDLRLWLADEPVSAWPEPWSARAGRWARRNRSKVAAGSALLIVGVVALAVSLALIDRERRRAVDAELQAEKMAEARADALRSADESMFATLAALDRMRSLASRDLAHVPAMTEARRQVAEAALTQLDGLLRRQPGHPTALGIASKVLRELALFDRLAGRYDGAEAHVLRAVELEQSGGTPRALNDPLAHCYLDLAMLRIARRDPIAAVEPNGEVLQIARAMMAAQPGGSNGGYLLAFGLAQRGRIRRELGRAEEAVVDYAESAALWDRLLAESPGGLDGQVQRCVALPQYGHALRDAGRLDESERVLDRAIGLLRDLAAEDPSDNDRRMLLCAALVQQAQTRIARGPEAVDPALVLTDEAVELARVLSEQYPELPAYRGELAQALDTRGDIHAEAGSTDSARADHQAALELIVSLSEAQPGSRPYHSLMADVLLDLADPSRSDFSERVDEAERHLQLAAERNDRDPEDRRSRDRIEALRARIRPTP